MPAVWSTQNVPTADPVSVRATPKGPAKIGWPPLPSAITRFLVVVRVRLVLSWKSPRSSRCVAPSSNPVLRIVPAFTKGIPVTPRLHGIGAWTSSPPDVEM